MAKRRWWRGAGSRGGGRRRGRPAAGAGKGAALEVGDGADG
jgi:hypothetical protein